MILLTIKKKLWHKKCVRRAIFWTVDVRKFPSTLTLFATRPLGHCATCKGSSYNKNEYNLFYSTIFSKKASIFWENRGKLFWEHIWQFFRERSCLAPKINITFFITIKVLSILLFCNFFKKAIFSEKMAKNRFRSPSLFWREGAVWRQKWI